ncbi:hypothetical protein RI367_000148 [Sorochytrium milnesiophthora]
MSHLAEHRQQLAPLVLPDPSDDALKPANFCPFHHNVSADLPLTPQALFASANEQLANLPPGSALEFDAGEFSPMSPCLSPGQDLFVPIAQLTEPAIPPPPFSTSYRTRRLRGRTSSYSRPLSRFTALPTEPISRREYTHLKEERQRQRERSSLDLKPAVTATTPSSSYATESDGGGDTHVSTDSALSAMLMQQSQELMQPATFVSPDHCSISPRIRRPESLSSSGSSSNSSSNSNSSRHVRRTQQRFRGSRRRKSVLITIRDPASDSGNDSSVGHDSDAYSVISLGVSALGPPHEHFDAGSDEDDTPAHTSDDDDGDYQDYSGSEHFHQHHLGDDYDGSVNEEDDDYDYRIQDDSDLEEAVDKDGKSLAEARPLLPRARSADRKHYRSRKPHSQDSLSSQPPAGDFPPVYRLLVMILALIAFSGFIIVLCFVIYASTHPIQKFHMHVGDIALTSTSFGGIHSETFSMNVSISGHNENYMSDIVIEADIPLAVWLVEISLSGLNQTAALPSNSPQLSILCPPSTSSSLAPLSRPDRHGTSPPSLIPALPSDLGPTNGSIVISPVVNTTYIGGLHLARHRKKLRFAPGRTAHWQVDASTQSASQPSIHTPVWSRFLVWLSDPTATPDKQYRLVIKGQYDYNLALTLRRYIDVCVISRSLSDIPHVSKHEQLV